MVRRGCAQIRTGRPGRGPGPGRDQVTATESVAATGVVASGRVGDGVKQARASSAGTAPAAAVRPRCSALGGQADFERPVPSCPRVGAGAR